MLNLSWDIFITSNLKFTKNVVFGKEITDEWVKDLPYLSHNFTRLFSSLCNFLVTIGATPILGIFSLWLLVIEAIQVYNYSDQVQC